MVMPDIVDRGGAMSAMLAATAYSSPDNRIPMLEGRQGRSSGVDTALKHDRPCEEEVLLQGFHELETPEGFRAEFIEGEIVVSPPPGGPHEKAISRTVRQIVQAAQTPMDFSGQKGLELASGKRCTKNYVIPDMVLVPEELDAFADAEPWMPPAGVAMVIEVTSSQPDRDRKVKRHCYAKAEVPFYLLVDRDTRTVTLFKEPDPEAEDYLEDIRVAFGKPLDLPEPFGFTLQTNDL
jgi:Uma2 family endonuclease